MILMDDTTMNPTAEPAPEEQAVPAEGTEEAPTEAGQQQ